MTAAKCDGQGVCGLMNGLVGKHFALQMLLPADLVLSAGEDCKIFGDRTVEVQLGENTAWSDVVMEIHLTMYVPKDEPVLLQNSPGRRPLEVGGMHERVGHRWDARPAYKPPEVLHPLPEAGERGLGAVDDIWRVRAVEDTRIVRANVHVEMLDVALTNWTVSAGNWQDQRGFRAIQSAITESRLAHQLRGED